MQKENSDTILIEQLIAGEQGAFDELVNRYTSKVYSLAFRVTKNAVDAEEVLQDTFMTVFRKVDKFEGKSSFSSWLYRVTVNAALMHLRKKKQDKSTPVEAVLLDIGAEGMRANSTRESYTKVSNGELASAIEVAVSKLPEDYRPVFILKDVDGLTSKEVSDVLGLSVAAVKSRLHRSRLMLRKTLMPCYREFVNNEFNFLKVA